MKRICAVIIGLSSLIFLLPAASASTIDLGTTTSYKQELEGNYKLSDYGGTIGVPLDLYVISFDTADAGSLLVTANENENPQKDFSLLGANLWSGSLGGTLVASAQSATPSDAAFTLSYSNLQAGTDYFLEILATFAKSEAVLKGKSRFAISVVPIPPALALFGTALAGLAALSRRRKDRSLAI